jgi:hypothetical protein
MSWALLSFAVILPLISCIGMAFRRREDALQFLNTFRSTGLELYQAHALWEPPQMERRWTHADAFLRELEGMEKELTRYLTLPTASRARHRMTSWGKQEASAIVGHQLLLDQMLQTRCYRISQLCEALKKRGLNVQEAIRIRNWERRLGEQIQHLRMSKSYRTPQALRSFARLFTMCLPIFYAPRFAQLAFDVNSLGVGIVAGILTAVGLTGLFSSVSMLEDSFVSSLDGICVSNELSLHQEMLQARDSYFPNAPPYSSNKKEEHRTTSIPDLACSDETSSLDK